MNKREILIVKLEALEKTVDMVRNDVDEKEKLYLDNYKKHVEDLLQRAKTGTLPASNGGLLGVLRAISEYDSLSTIKPLYAAAAQAEKYYSFECKEW